MKTKEADELPDLTITFFQKLRAGRLAIPCYRQVSDFNHSIFHGIIDADLRACSRDKNEIVLSRGSAGLLRG